MPVPSKKVRQSHAHVTTIVFDFGNVLVIDTEKIFEERFNLKDLPKYKRDHYEAMSHRTERGELPTIELLKTMQSIFALPYSIREIEEMMIHTELITPMWRLLCTLRENYSVAILTNNQKNWPEKTAKFLGIELNGIPMFNSADIGKRKPLKYPYQFMVKHLGIKPYQLVFIDDKKKNIETAKKLGIKAIHFTGDMVEVIANLKKYGVEATL